MNRLKAGLFLFLISIVAFGCSQKKEISGVSTLGLEEDKDMVQTITSPEAIELQQEVVQLEIQPPETPVQPVQTQAATAEDRNKQIQTALKNAHLYFGEIDGKIGPLTRKAIEEFQKMKGLKVDGKVGPVTWAELQKYLTVETKNKK